MQGNAPDEEHEDPHGECTHEIALLKKRAAKAIQLIQDVAPQSAIGALNGDYDADL